MHRSLASSSTTLRRLAIPQRLPSSISALKPSRTSPPARSLSFSPACRSTANESTPSSSPSELSRSTPTSGAELELELESVPPPASPTTPSPSVDDARRPAEVVSTEDIILEEIGRPSSDPVPESTSTSVKDSPSASTDASPDLINVKVAPRVEVPTGSLASRRLIATVDDFMQHRIASFASAPPEETKFEIFDPDENAQSPTVNYFALWPGVNPKLLCEAIFRKAVDELEPPPETAPPASDSLQFPDPDAPALRSSAPSPNPTLPSLKTVTLPPAFTPQHTVPLAKLQKTLKWVSSSVGNRNQPHLTLLHDSTIMGLPASHPYVQLWDRFLFLSLQPASPTYTVTFSHVVWDADLVMVLVVDSIELDVKEGMDQEYIELWSLPPVAKARFHVSVKVNHGKVGTHVAGEMMRRWRVLDETKRGLREGEGWEEVAKREKWDKLNEMRLLTENGEGGLGGFQARFAARDVASDRSLSR